MSLVSVKMAHVLRDYGYPQDMRVGEYAWHPLAKRIVQCTLKRKSPQGVLPVANPVVKMPTEREAEAFLHTLSPKSVVDIRAAIAAA